MKIIKGDLVMKEDMTFHEDLRVEGNITGKNGIRYNLRVVGDIYCGDIECGNIDCWNIECGNITAKDISYYAVCFAYENIKCNSIKGTREPCKEPFVFDGTIKIGQKKVCDKCGSELK